MNDLHYFINVENFQNFADDNTLTDQTESLTAFRKSYDCQPLQIPHYPIQQRQSGHRRYSIKIKDQLSVSESKVELLGITIDNRLSFEAHTSNLCKKAALQLNALKRLAKFLGF